MRTILVVLIFALSPAVALADGFGPPGQFGVQEGESPGALAADAAGAVAAIWTTDPGTCTGPGRCSALDVAVRPAGGTSARANPVGTAGGSRASLAGFFLDRAGVATAVYQQDGRGISIVRCRPRSCGPSRKLDPADSTATAAAMDGAGRVLVVWRGHTSRGPRLKAALMVRGHLGRPQVLGESGGQPAVAAGAGGFLAAWPIPGAMRTARLQGTTLGAPRTISEDPYQRNLPTDLRLAGTRRGYVAAWRDGDGVDAVTLDRRGRRIRDELVRMTDGRLSLVAAPSGRALLVTCGEGVVLSSREAEGDLFSTPSAPLTDAECGYAVAMDAAGRATLAWNTKDGPVAALTQHRGGFSAAAPLDPGACDTATFRGCPFGGPALATSGRRTWAMWHREPFDVQLAERTL